MADRNKWAEALRNLIPLQDRTIASTVMGDKSTITQNNLSQQEINRLNDLIEKSREYRAPLVQSKNADLFNSGAGYVDYNGYTNANQMGSEWDMSQKSALKNTLGQFRYKTLPNGNVKIEEVYDFANDNPGVLPKEVANSARYEGMNPLAKALLLAKETISMPGHGFDPQFGWDTIPSRFGNAYVGKDGRKIDIEFTPRQPLKTIKQISSDQAKYEADKEREYK